MDQLGNVTRLSTWRLRVRVPSRTLGLYVNLEDYLFCKEEARGSNPLLSIMKSKTIPSEYTRIYVYWTNIDTDEIIFQDKVRVKDFKRDHGISPHTCPTCGYHDVIAKLKWEP